MPRSYRIPIYVEPLFELLRFLGVEQKAVGQHLGASKSHVSMWASGDCALSQRQALPFLRFVTDKLMEADRQAKAHSRPLRPARRVPAHAGARSLLNTPPLAVQPPQREIPAPERTTYDEFRDKVNALLGQWELALMRARGDIHRIYCEQVEILETYKPQDSHDLFKLPQADLARIERATRTIQRCLRFRAQLESPPEERPWVDGPPQPAYFPVVHLWTVAAKADLWLDDEADRKYIDYIQELVQDRRE
jgi:hypothetical protein